MKDKQSLKEQLDNVNTKLQQIDNHALAKADAHTKELYMNLLAAIAFEDRKVSEKEERYLHALCNGIREIEYKTMISGIDRIGDVLEEALRVIEKDNLKFWLFIDALILCRLDSEITEEESELLGSLADSLRLTPEEVTFCLKLATVILSQDEALLYEMISKVPKDFPFYDLQEAYISPWFDAKLTFAEDLAQGRELKGKYLILRPVRISSERELKDIELVFAKGTSINIGKKAKLKINDSKLNQARIVCGEKSALTLNNCNLSGGQGISCYIGSSLTITQCRLDNASIVLDKASKMELDEVIFDNFTEKRAMSITKCTDVTLKKSKFISCGYGIENPEKEEGGALLVKDSFILIDSCQFENCTASGDGGAISFWKSGYSINDSKFIRCKSGINGGAMVVHDTLHIGSDMQSLKSIARDSYGSDSTRGKGVPICMDVEFMECEATSSGGAVMSYTRNLRFFNCLFDKCSAPHRGGGATVMGSDLSNYYTRFFKCRFVENNAKYGNGLWMQRFRCGNQGAIEEDKGNDIRSSSFHKCTTNHEHDKNSDGRSRCLLYRQNKFTE